MLFIFLSYIVNARVLFFSTQQFCMIEFTEEFEVVHL